MDNIDNINKKLSLDFLKYLFGDTYTDLTDIKLDNISVYSITPRDQADIITDVVKNYFGKKITVTDMTACIGGNTISFAKDFEKINAIEICKERFNFLKHNSEINKFNNIKFYLGDSIQVIKNLTQDVIFIDPPWLGKSYKYKKNINLFLSSIPIYDICNDLYGKSKSIVLKIPKNFNIIKFNNKTLHSDIYLYEFKKINLLVLKNSEEELTNHEINEKKYTVKKL